MNNELPRMSARQIRDIGTEAKRALDDNRDKTPELVLVSVRAVDVVRLCRQADEGAKASTLELRGEDGRNTVRRLARIILGQLGEPGAQSEIINRPLVAKLAGIDIKPGAKCLSWERTRRK